MERSLDEIHNTCDQAITILRATHDGEDLEPRHLKLVEMAVNGLLNDTGKAAFAKLLNSVTQGRYVKPWFHGIEHLTRDHAGYVRWKGVEIEHYDPPWCYSEAAKEQAEEVARRCRLLEEHGVQPTSGGRVIWRWEEVSANWHHGRR